MDQLYKAGAITAQDGAKAREVLVTSPDQILGKDSSDNSE